MGQFYRLCIIALLATCLGVGIFRFSYTALMPMTIDQHWWSASFASYLSSANLLGYLLGAVIAFTVIKPKIIPQSILFSALLGSISLVLCGLESLPHLWYIFWRVISGVTGGVLMVLAPSYALSHTPAEQRHKLSLIAFSGIGIGVLLATTILPKIASLNVAWAWYILGIFSLIASLVIYILLKQTHSTTVNAVVIPTANFTKLTSQQIILSSMVIIAYLCCAIAYIPHSLFWVEFIIHQLHFPVAVANFQWMLYGLGAVFGALAAFCCVHRWGIWGAMVRLYVLYAIGIFIPSIFTTPLFLSISSLITGLLNPAVVSLSSTALLYLVSPARHRFFWGINTTAFAIAQLIGGLLMSYLLNLGFHYQELFFMGGCIMLFALCLTVLLYLSMNKNQGLSN